MTPAPFLDEDAMTLRRYCFVEEAEAVKDAVTPLSDVMVTVHTLFTSTESQPVQPLKVEPASGWAARVTPVP
jgi:hypothetical protein